MWIVKLGGSLLGSAELRHWLDLFARYADGHIVIVPGGGIFADAVREAQTLAHFSDEVAHRMAVMAMDQYGVLLAGLNPALVTARSELEIAERGWQHRAIVWLPSQMVMADENIPASWHVTSDSLAAWLAAKLNAEHLILVKSLRPQSAQYTVQELMQEGIVDVEFDNFIAAQNFSTWILGKSDFDDFSDGLSEVRLQQIGYRVARPIMNLEERGNKK